MENLFYGMDIKSTRRRRRRRKGPVLLILLLLAVGIGFGVYFIVNKINENKIDDNDNEITKTAEADPDSNSAWQIEEDPNNPNGDEFTAKWTNRDESLDGNGSDEVYGLWTQPKATEAPEATQNPDDEEEVWMGDFVDTRERIKAKGIYVSSAYINKKLDDAIALIDKTELNAIIIDIKSPISFRCR